MTYINRINTLSATIFCCAFILISQNNLQAQTATIKTDEVTIYPLPMVTDSSLATLKRGDKVQVLGQRGEWVKIEVSPELKGWMQLPVKSLPQEPEVEPEPEKPTKEPGQLSMASAYFEPEENESTTPANAASKPQRSIPDLIRKKPVPIQSDGKYRRFGYTFGAGFLETDFTYNWKFIFHQTPRMALEGSFKHALGEAASSYFIFANLNYMLTSHIRRKFLPYASVGAGVINTVPENSINVGRGVSHMAINYGIGARKYFKPQIAFVFNVSQYSVFIDKGVTYFREYTAGLLVGKFWD